MTGLNPGDTLILQAFQTNPFDFELCLEDAPPSANNNCVDAISLQIYNEGECEGNFVSASIKNNSVSINPSCAYIAADVFYKVTVPENGQFRIVSDSYQMGLSIYTTCNTSSLICNSYIDNTIVRGLPANEEVLIQFFQDGIPDDFELCIETAIPTSNNDCSNALPINVVPSYEIFERTNKLNIKNNTIDVDPACYYSKDKDVFYEFTVPENGKIAFNTAYTQGIAVYKSCEEESVFCENYIDDIAIISDLPPGEVLILQIFDRYGYNNIEFSISEVVDNISCENTKALCQSILTGSNVGATQSFSTDESDCIPYYDDLDNIVWYSFTTNNTGNPVTFEITKTKCTNQYDDLYVSLVSNVCGSDYFEEDCIKIEQDGNKGTITLNNPVQNKLYYLMMGNDSGYVNCGFEINILNGIEFDCCRLDYTTSNWCYNINPNNYFVDITVNDLGQNPSGYEVAGTNKRITEAGTVTIGPIPNGMNTLTLQGLDMGDCITTETIYFNCADCAEHLHHSNTSIKRDYNFNASKTIESDVQVMPATYLKYAAGDSIILKQGFSVENGAELWIDIEDCE